MNVDTFFTACSENGFFIRHLKLHAMIKHPTFEKDGRMQFNVGNKEYLDFMQGYDKVGLNIFI